ncbi:MAG: PKD domain-containing protein, partial [Bacteroidota bacterium]
MPRRIITFVLFLVLFCLEGLEAQVKVDFVSQGATTGCGSLQASFCAEASSTAGDITSYEWSLGGVSSSLECPGRIFGSPGQYTICLTATDSEGNEKQICKDDFITVLALPEAAFTADETRGCVPLEVNFTNESVPADGKITKYIWGLGGSNSVIEDDGSLPVVSSTYTVADEYTVSLTVEDENGCTNTAVKPKYIAVSPNPEIKVSLDDSISCSAPFIVQFTNESNTDNTAYSWDFGNGFTFNGYQPPAVQYSEIGTYSISIEATIPATGCTETLLLEDKVSVGYPVEFETSTTEVCAGEKISFIDYSEIEADSILWDFGDGTTSNQPESLHSYTEGGNYTITLYRFIEGCPSKKESIDLITVLDQPLASFVSDNVAGCTLPHTVNFSASSTETVTWLWDFGDGTTSEERNPSHEYEEFGTYDVMLIVTNEQGCQAEVTNRTIEIASLEADLSVSGTDGCVPKTFDLADNSISVVPIENWLWEVNGQSYTGSNPSVTLADTGKYDVQLIVVNTLGCRDTVFKPELLRVGDALDVEFELDKTESCVEAPVTFTDLSSDFADSWTWTFGDTALFEQNPVYEFPDTGTYDITLIITQNGCPSSLTKEAYITVLEPKARYKFELSCADPYTVVFEDTSIGADSIFWDFGVEGITTDTSSMGVPVFTFPTTGAYEVSLTAFSSATGCTHTIEKTIMITDPKADFNLSTMEGCVPLNVRVLDNSDFAAEWQWYAPGGTVNNPTSPTPTITYSTPGAYSVIQLVITDINNCTDTLVFTDTIYVNGVNADFTLDPAGGCVPLNVNFQDQSSSVFGENQQWEWTMGEDLATLSGTEVDYLFEEKGSYPITLKVTDDWGCVGTKRVEGAVLVTEPEAKFFGDSLSCTATPVQFTNESNGINLVYSWDFGDGNFSDEKDPQHQYEQEGTYTVCLSLTDINGCTDRLCLDNYVTIADPVASFSITDAYASCPPLIAEFVNSSQNADKWEWDFGDDSGTADLENPPHVYTQPGSYTVSLVASSTPGCTDTLVLEDLIRLDGPTGTFDFEVDSSCVPVKITLMGASDDEYEYVWDLGNGDLITRPGRLAQDTFVYYYEEPGIYTPKLRLIDVSTDCEVVVEPDEDVFVTGLSANFTALDTTLCDGEMATQFINLTNSNVPITFLEWTFEEGSPIISRDLEPRVTFTAGGAYDVMLVAGNEYCRDTLIKEDFIRIGAVPEAAFSSTPDGGCEPFPVQFSDNSSVTNGSIVAWEWNFGDEGFSVEQNPQHTYNDGGDFQVVLTVTSDMGCEAEATTVIPVQQAMDVSIAEVAPICIGEAVPLEVSISDTTGISVRWENSADLSCLDCVQPLASPEDTATFTIVVSNDIGCQNSASITVDVRPFRVPDINVTADTTICSEDAINIYVFGIDDVFAYNWDTNSPGLSCYDNCANPIATPDISTTYYVSATSREGCTSIDSVQVDVVEAVQALASDDKIICIGDSIQLDIDFGDDPRWLNPTRLDCAYCPSPGGAPIETTTYVVEVTDEFGCRIQDSVRVEVVQRDEVDAGMDQSLCLGDEVLIEGIGVGDIRWTPNIGLSSGSGNTVGLSPMQTTTYYMTVTNGDCIMTDSIRIEVVDKTTLSVEDVTICAGELIDLSVNGTADTYEWTPVEDATNNTEAIYSVAPTTTTTYSVIGQLSTCEADTAYATVEVIPLPNV